MDNNLKSLIDAVYPDIGTQHERNFYWLGSRAIVSPRKVAVTEINNLIIKKSPWPGQKLIID